MARSRKKNSTLIVIGGLLAATAVYIGAGKLLSRDAADRYFEVESRSFQRLAQSINAYYNTFMENQKPFLETPNRRHLEITADTGTGPLEPGGKVPIGTATAGIYGKTSAGKALGGIAVKTSSGKVLGGIAGKTPVGKTPTGLAGLIGSKLVIDTRSRPDTGYSISDISFLTDKENVFNARLFTEDTALYLSIPLLTPGKYFSARLDRLGEAYDRFSVPIKPTKLINGPNIAGILKFDKTTFMDSASRLAAVIKKFVKPDNVRYGQNLWVQISGQSYKGREIIVSLDEEQATSLLYELAFAVAEDGALLRYTYGNIAGLSSLLDDAGLFRLYGYLQGRGAPNLNGGMNSLPELLNIKKDMESFRHELQENAARLTVKDGLVMTLAVDNAGNILERKTKLDLLYAVDNSLSTLEVETGSSNNVFEDVRNRFADIVLTHYRSSASGDDGSSAGSSSTGSAPYNAAGGSANSAGTIKSVSTANSTSTINSAHWADDVCPANSANLKYFADVGKTTEIHIRPDFGKPADTGSNGSFTVSWLTAVQGGSPSGVDMKLDFSNKTDMLTLEKSRSIDYSAKLMTGRGEGTVRVKWNEVSPEDKQPDSRERNVTLDFNADLPFLGIDKFSSVLALAEEDSFGIEPFSLPPVNAGNTTDLNTAAPKDIERIKSHVRALFGNYQH